MLKKTIFLSSIIFFSSWVQAQQQVYEINIPFNEHLINKICIISKKILTENQIEANTSGHSWIEFRDQNNITRKTFGVWYYKNHWQVLENYIGDQISTLDQRVYIEACAPVDHIDVQLARSNISCEQEKYNNREYDTSKYEGLLSNNCTHFSTSVFYQVTNYDFTDEMKGTIRPAELFRSIQLIKNSNLFDIHTYEGSHLQDLMFITKGSAING